MVYADAATQHVMSGENVARQCQMVGWRVTKSQEKEERPKDYSVEVQEERMLVQLLPYFLSNHYIFLNHVFSTALMPKALPDVTLPIYPGMGPALGLTGKWTGSYIALLE